jgi:tetratricopeptide (TPR) repeat protein
VNTKISPYSPALAPRTRPADGPPAGPRERLNTRLLAVLVGVSVLFGGAWYGLNRWQVRRHATALLAQADVAKAQGRPDRAARFIGLYVGLVPSDTEARARYGMLLDRLATTPRARAGAMAVFEQVLLREPERHDIRKRLVALELDAGQFDDAEQHLSRYLREAFPEDPEVEELQGRCHEGRGEYARAAEAYRTAVSHAPGRTETRLRLARLLRDQLARPEEARLLLAKMVEEDKEPPRALLARARYLQEGTPSAQALQTAQQDVSKALRQAPDDADVLLAAADLGQRLPGGLEEARRHLAHFAERYPSDPRGDEALAALEVRSGRVAEAVAALRHALDRSPDQADLMWNLANLLIQRGDADEGTRLAARLDGLGMPAPRTDYLRAAALMARGDQAGAARALEAVRPLLADSRELTAQCDLLLARCYGALGNAEAQILVCRRVVAADPMQGGARMMLAVALQRLGRGAEALEECQRVLALPNPPATGTIQLARVMTLQNLRLPPRQRQWVKVEQALDQAAKADPEAVEVPVLRAEVLVARGETARARELLEAARAGQPKRVELWAALADLEARDHKPEAAFRLLDEAEKQVGDGAPLRVARLRCLLASGAADSEASFETVSAGLDRLPEAERVTVLAAVAEAHEQLGRSGEARRLWDEVVRLRPNDLDAHLHLFDLALRGEDAGQAAQALDALRHVEGEGGVLGRYNEARLLIRQAERGDKSGLTKAREELQAVSRRRPGWSQVAVCQGQINDLEGNEDRAVENYLRAIELGDRQPEVVRRALRLLYDRRRYADAELVIQRLPDQGGQAEGFQRLATEVSLQTGNYNRALELAGKAVRADSDDYRDHVWLGQVLWAAAQRADVETGRRREAEARAEAALRRAVELAPAAPDARVALVQYLARTGQTAAAREETDRAAARLPAGQAALVLAQCHVAVNQLDRARELFATALKERPDDLAALRAGADFYLRINDVTEAERCLRKVIAVGVKDAAAAAWARAVLAVVLASHGDYQSSREALALVGLMDGRRDDGPAAGLEQERARAVVLALQPGRKQTLEAIDILERLAARQPLSPEDRFLLVQLYERVGEAGKARDRLLPLVQSGGNARYLAHHIDRLLREGRTSEAEGWLPDLEKLQPGSLPVAALRARLLKARGKMAEGAALLKRQAEGKDAATAARVAALVEDLGDAAGAEDLYRRYAAESKQPDRALVLARYYGRHGRVREALDLCEGTWAACAPEAVGEASVGVLNDAGAAAGADDRTRVERRITQELGKRPGSAGLTVCLASLEEVGGRYEKAEALYRQAIERDPRNAIALNNLAWILALRQGRGEEALALVGRAIDVLGPIPELLDTRAVAALAAGRRDAALADLREALGRTTLDPKVRASLSFHLAQAEAGAGAKEEAEKAWREATSAGLKAELLHGLERPAYDKLARAMGRP